MGTSQSRKRLIGGTALTDAVRRGDIVLVGRLLEPCFGINAKDNWGSTALRWAAQEGHTAIAELLLAEGANVNAKDNEGGTPLIVAAARGHAEVVRLLLAVPGIDVDAHTNRGDTALMVAERRGHTDVVRAINSFLAAQAMNRWIPRHRSRQRDRLGLSELDGEGTPFMDLVYYHTQGFL